MLIMSKAIFIEGVSPKGHTVFTQAFLNLLSNDDGVLYVGRTLNGCLSFSGETIEFDDSFLLQSRLQHAIGCIFYSIKAINKAKNKQADKIYLMSYDIISIPIISFLCFVFGIKLYAFEHNTVPQSFFKKMLQFLAFNVRRICFTPKAKEIYESMGQKAYLISLPFNEKPISLKVDQEEKYVFCPSASVSICDVITYVEINSEFLFYVKSNEKYSKKKNMIVRKYFDSYEEMLFNSKAIYVPITSVLRMSGPVIDAISYGKPVVMRKTSLSIYLKRIYPGFIYFDEKPLSEILDEFSIARKVNLKELNSNVRDCLNEIVNKK